MRIEVDPSSLGGVGYRLLHSAEVAREVSDGAAFLKSLAEGAGDAGLQAAIHSFLDRWRYGCGCLFEDARQVADRLERTSRVYVQTETKISGAASGGG